MNESSALFCDVTEVDTKDDGVVASEYNTGTERCPEEARRPGAIEEHFTRRVSAFTFRSWSAFLARAIHSV